MDWLRINTGIQWRPVISGSMSMAWRVLSLRMEERPPIRRVAANMLNKQLLTADKGWSSSLGLGEVLTTRRKNVSCCDTVKKQVSDLDWYIGATQATKKGHEIGHNRELNELYPLQNIVQVIKSRRMNWVGHIARMGDRRVVCRVLVGKPEGKRPLGRPRRRWENNVKMNIQEVGCGGLD